MTGYTFTKSERLVEKKDFQQTRARGALYKEGAWGLAVNKSAAGKNRLGVVVRASKVKNASARNRLKRLVREVFRLNKSSFLGGPYDIVVMANGSFASRVRYGDVEQPIAKILKRARIL